MQDIYNEEDMIHVERPDRKGCAVILGTLVIVLLFWIIVGIVYLFT